MPASAPLDSLGHRRSPAAVSGYLTGRRPRSKGRRYAPDPPRTEEIIAVMRCCGDGHHGDRARGLIAVLWPAGLRSQEALDLGELDLDARRGSVLVRSGTGGRRREVGMDNWGFEQLEPWLRARERMPVGPLFCLINGPNCRRAWHASAARAALRRRAARAGVHRPRGDHRDRPRPPSADDPGPHGTHAPTRPLIHPSRPRVLDAALARPRSGHT